MTTSDARRGEESELDRQSFIDRDNGWHSRRAGFMKTGWHLAEGVGLDLLGVAGQSLELELWATSQTCPQISVTGAA